MEFTLINIALIIHAFLCLIYMFIFFRISKIYIYLYPFVVFFPYVWIIFFGIGYFFIFVIMRNASYDKSGLIMQIDQDDEIIERGTKTESNIVPVEEALILNENEIQREMVIEIAKRDPSEYLDKLKLALLSDDSETAHYASSSISKLKRSIDKELREVKETYEADPDNISARKKYIKILDFAIKSNLGVDVIIEKYIDEIIKVLEYHIQNSEEIASKYYEMLIKHLIETNKTSYARLWANEFQEIFDDREEPLLYKMEIAYITKNIIEFDAAISELEQAKFPVSNKTMEMVEFWRSGR